MTDNSDRLCDEIVEILTPKIGDIRIIKVWNDYFADYIYYLQEYRSFWYYFFNMDWLRSSQWHTRTTSSEEKFAQRWAEHYKIIIQEIADNFI